MTKEFEHYHGVVFAKLLHGTPAPICIGFYPSKGNSSYILGEEKAGLYIKHSTKRMSPWRFTFSKAHQDEILEMYNKFGEVFTALVCRDDGVVILNFAELKAILDHNHDETEWIAISRGRRTQYTVSGSDGELGFKVSLRSCPEKILGFLYPNSQTSEQPHTSSAFPTLPASLLA